ncbi:MAG TPA: glycosyltransferase [Leptospiraceae bacterium]|nr:glycosyltransferase [Leptospiraceae bacterium]
MAEPLVSVVMPSFNHARYILESIQSVLAQDFSDFELIVVDDASTDNTREVLESIGDDRVRFRINEHTGLPAITRNTGIAMARGEMVAFLDSDDLWEKNKLSSQLEMLRAHPECGFCYHDFDTFDSETRKVLSRFGETCSLFEGDIAGAMLQGNMIGSPTPLIQKSLLLRAGCFPEDWSVRFFEDWELWLRLAGLSPAAFVPAILAHYRIHSRPTFSGAALSLRFKTTLQVINRAVKDMPDRFKPHLPAALNAAYRIYGPTMLSQGATASFLKILFAQFMVSGPIAHARAFQFALRARRVARRKLDSNVEVGPGPS